MASPQSKRVFVCWADTDDTESLSYKTKIIFARSADTGADEFEVPVYLDAQNQTGNKLASFQDGSVVDTGSEPTSTGSRTPFSSHVFTPSPSVVAQGDNVYIMWVGQTDLLAGQANRGDSIHVNSKLRFAASSDAGSAFGEIIDLGSYTMRDQSTSANFRLRARDSRIYVLWNQFDSAWSGTMLLRKSRDGGRSFGPPIALDGMRYEGQPESSQVRLGDIAVIDDVNNPSEEFLALYIVTEQPKKQSMMDFMPNLGSSAAYLVKASINEHNALNFKDPVKVIEDSAPGSDIPLRVCENFVHIVWTGESGESMHLRSSSDYGKSFGPKATIKMPQSRTGQWNWGRYPIVWCQSESAFVAWHHGSNSSASIKGQQPKMPPIVYLSASFDGKSFLDPVTISADKQLRSAHPNFIFDDSNVYFAWAEGNEQYSDILFRKLTIQN
jgi:hypothetical protein